MTSYQLPPVLPPAPALPYPPVPLPPSPPHRRWRTVATVGATAVCIFAAGVGGVMVGAHFNNARPETSKPVAVAPTADQVRVATVDLCTRFAAGYRAMPKPPTSGADVIPTLSYITAALVDNPAADSQIRAAVAESLRVGRDQAAWLSHEPARGAIRPPTDWEGLEANAADQRVWNLCRAYGD